MNSTSQRARTLLTTLTFTLLISFSACQSRPSTSTAQADVVLPLRFPHASHVEVACAHCHPPASAASANTLRPGQDAHQSCNTAPCHAKDFAGPPTQLCGLCHENLAQTNHERSTLVPFPPQTGTRTQAVAFSHQQHLNADRMEQLLGFHISCTDCHTPYRSTSDNHTFSKDSKLLRPSHKACARCHAAEAALPDHPTMERCQSCHQANLQRNRDRQLVTGDLHFSHALHQSDRRGKRMGCATCHIATLQARGNESDTHTPAMQACVSCHNDETRVAPDRRMSRCETCHYTRFAGVGALAPRSHMPATERPANHTQAFRRDHAKDARMSSAPCGRCHTMVSGNRRNTCDECHQVMRPQDHTVTWREYDHGTQATTQPDRCATCHQVDVCISCHQTSPRSHFPALSFRNGGHGTLAVFNMRACVTCHEVRRDCQGPGCHQGDGL